MALATADPEGRPSLRYVLLKGVDEHGIRFFTNYESRKGRELLANPRGALALYWLKPLERQVRAEGRVEPLSAEESDAYFRARARRSQLGALASRQGQVLADDDSLEERVARLEEEYRDRPVPRPDYWGGFRLVPDAVEFWQGRPNRLHERRHFLREEGGGWRVERLSP